MKISDLNDKDFETLLNHSMKVSRLCDELQSFNGLNMDKERKLFISPEELKTMKQNNATINNEQSKEFWKIIEAEELSKRTFHANEQIRIALEEKALLEWERIQRMYGLKSCNCNCNQRWANGC